MNSLNEKQLQMAKETIEATLRLEKIQLTNQEMNWLIDDLYNLIIEAGGDFTKENLRYYLLEYVRNDFYPRFKLLHKDD